VTLDYFSHGADDHLNAKFRGQIGCQVPAVFWGRYARPLGTRPQNDHGNIFFQDNILYRLAKGAAAHNCLGTYTSFLGPLFCHFQDKFANLVEVAFNIFCRNRVPEMIKEMDIGDVEKKQVRTQLQGEGDCPILVWDACLAPA
jgi:hypothetical protein